MTWYDLWVINITNHNRIFVMSSPMIKCPYCEYEFQSPFQESEEIKNIHTNCRKCANSFDVDSNRI